MSPAAEAQLRALLEADGKPVIKVSAPGQKYDALMVPYYPAKEGAMTWTSVTYETLTLRDGVVIASRGLGADLMAAQAPQAAQIVAGQGSFHRIYEYLGPNDGPESFDFDCDFAVSGSETITVLQRSYPTTKITETCYKGENRFENAYWVDRGGKIRQSSQISGADKATDAVAAHNRLNFSLLPYQTGLLVLRERDVFRLGEFR